ncbi:hypothetical protein P3W85_19965 [Cupriavidus basilensis]|uniref:Secreted protein n=1 Tax=Cupriavidus basilensis TaxID=68895 RepID=A0ABT6ARG4_9BURK|nr:hypothetical protein [Cupriavidus basilensis]MDF3835220.1 hypothetical protein [Cupriavidus basilensis]
MLMALFVWPGAVRYPVSRAPMSRRERAIPQHPEIWHIPAGALQHQHVAALPALVGVRGCAFTRGQVRRFFKIRVGRQVSWPAGLAFASIARQHLRTSS